VPAPRREGVEPLRRVDHDPELGADVSQVYGYRAHCPCSWKGERRDTWGIARRDLTEHKVTEHGAR
jgi:hypothetical protein